MRRWLRLFFIAFLPIAIIFLRCRDDFLGPSARKLLGFSTGGQVVPAWFRLSNGSVRTPTGDGALILKTTSSEQEHGAVASRIPSSSDKDQSRSKITPTSSKTTPPIPGVTIVLMGGQAARRGNFKQILDTYKDFPKDLVDLVLVIWQPIFDKRAHPSDPKSKTAAPPEIPRTSSGLGAAGGDQHLEVGKKQEEAQAVPAPDTTDAAPPSTPPTSSDGAANQEKGPSSTKSKSPQKTELRLVLTEHNSMINRYNVTQEHARTEAILLVDDDLLMTEQGVRVLFEKWKKNPGLLVGMEQRFIDPKKKSFEFFDGEGVPGRGGGAGETETTTSTSSSSDTVQEHENISSSSSRHRLPTGRTIMFARSYLDKYLNDRELVDYTDRFPCEDIGLGAVVGNATNGGDAVMAGALDPNDTKPQERAVYADEEEVRLLDEAEGSRNGGGDSATVKIRLRQDIPDQAGLSSRRNWAEVRNSCVAWLADHFCGEKKGIDCRLPWTVS